MEWEPAALRAFSPEPNYGFELKISCIRFVEEYCVSHELPGATFFLLVRQLCSQSKMVATTEKALHGAKDLKQLIPRLAIQLARLNLVNRNIVTAETQNLVADRVPGWRSGF